MVVKIEVIRGKELAEKFKSAGKKIQGRIDKALYKAGLLVERRAKILVRVDTGRCRASITTRLTYANAEVGTIVEYAPALEKRYPFLKLALDTSKTEIKRILHKGLSDAMAASFKGFTKIF
jgi:phage gpG-like protein